MSRETARRYGAIWKRAAAGFATSYPLAGNAVSGGHGEP